MPIYEYKCAACGHRMEKLQRLSDDPLKDCPACGRPELSKLVSAAAFKLKGTGWYETDFKNKGQPADKNQTDKSNKTQSDTAVSSSANTEKPASKTAKTQTTSKKASD